MAASRRPPRQRRRVRLDQHGLGVTPSVALDGERRAGQQAARVASVRRCSAPASRSGLEVARASQAPSSIADQSLAAPVKGTSDRARDARAVDQDADVAGGGVQQAEQAGVLEQAGRRVDEQKVDVLLRGEPREVDGRARSR